MMREKLKLKAYCLEWHMTTSGSMHDLLINPLAPSVDIQQVAWTGVEELPPPPAGETVIFYMMPPTQAWLKKYDNPVIWVPMIDNTLRPANFANQKNVRVVAFSEVTQRWAEELGFPFIRLKFFLDPKNFAPAKFDDQLVVLYWNRENLFDKSFLEEFCHKMNVNHLIFRDKIDPHFPPDYGYQLPAEIGKTRVETHTTFTTYEGYLALLDRCNIFFVPRRSEGVGLTMLEALAKGCAVFAYDAPAMNEYITHGKNGVLLNHHPIERNWLQYLMMRLYRGLHRRYYMWRYKKSRYYTDKPIWNIPHLSKSDLQQMGLQAREESAKGYADWIASIEKYAQFIIGSD